MTFIKKSFTALSIAVCLSGTLVSCKNQEKKDNEAKAKIEAMLPSGVNIEVKEGVATLNGTFKDEAAKAAAGEMIKKVEGIKSLVNNGTIEVPATSPAPVVINPDQALIDGATTVLKEFPGVMADIKDGVITLKGDIKKADWMKLKPLLDGLHPKKVMSNMNIK